MRNYKSRSPTRDVVINHLNGSQSREKLIEQESNRDVVIKHLNGSQSHEKLTEQESNQRCRHQPFERKPEPEFVNS
jgi:hypothetical protein